MGKANKDSASQVEQAPGFEGRYEDLGGYVVGFERYTADQDVAPLFRGLPDDACQCPHWGVVTRGRLTFRYTDGTSEEYVEGDAYYARPGHTPLFTAGTEVVEFSPSTDLATTMAVVMANLRGAEDAHA
jgi:hypothetical protein